MAKKDDLSQKLTEVLDEGALVQDPDYGSGVAMAAQIGLAQLRSVMAACRDVGYYLESLTGLDFTDTDELVYHVSCCEPFSRAAIRLLCGKDQAVPSVSDIFPSALWQEREVSEMFGIEFVDHPDLKPLLLPEDADFHPLRKDFGKVYAYHKREEIYG